MHELNGGESAATLRDFFAIQIQFAETLATRGTLPLCDALTFYTNLHRRFAYGNIARRAPSPEFLAFARRVAALPAHRERVELAVSSFAERPKLGAPLGSVEFGCFRCEPPDADGHVRLHFTNQDTSNDVSPLHLSKYVRRRDELTELVSYVARTFPHAQAIVGSSWLYNTKAYCRLFPASFLASRAPVASPNLHGGSIWGQFIDFRSAIKPAARTAFVTRLGMPDFDPKRPWRVFTLQPLKASAPLEVFRREYDC
jgi:hypothetical protein